MAGQAVTDVDASAAELHEEAAVVRSRVDRLGEGANELAGPPLQHTGRCACAVRPEAAPRLVAFDAENDRDVGRGGLGAKQAAKLHPRDARHPEIRDDRGGRRGERHVRTCRGVGCLVNEIPLGPQTAAKDLPASIGRIDQQHSPPRVHNRQTTGHAEVLRRFPLAKHDLSLTVRVPHATPTLVASWSRPGRVLVASWSRPGRVLVASWSRPGRVSTAELSRLLVAERLATSAAAAATSASSAR